MQLAKYCNILQINYNGHILTAIIRPYSTQNMQAATLCRYETDDMKPVTTGCNLEVLHVQ